MQVKLARPHGFCFGVQHAIELAEQAVAEKGSANLIAPGPVIHNKQVVERLEGAGLNQSGDLETVPEGSSVLIPSHGVRPETLKRVRARNLKLVDATCVLVKRAQDVVCQLHEEGYQVVMIGDRKHPEVQGVIGYAPEVIVVDQDTDLDQVLGRRARLGIVAQTTHAPQHVAEMIGRICSRNFKEIKIVNTLCMEVVRRQEAAAALCKQVEVMFVLGGLHSANTRALARLCQEQGVDTYHLETWEQFGPQMVAGKRSAGVTAGTSTPEWVISDFVQKLEVLEP